jgi:hypothetical protein
LTEKFGIGRRPLPDTERGFEVLLELDFEFEVAIAPPPLLLPLPS